MPASDHHREYTKNKDRWQLVRDCVEGSDAIKNAKARGVSTDGNKQTVTGIHNLSGSRYLPVPNPSDDSQENVNRYQQYKLRAVFINFTGHTKDGFTGMISRKKSEIELDPSIEHLKDNSDGTGQSLQQLIQSTLSNVLEVGRYGLLSDFPISQEGQTAAQTSGLESTVKCYPAESIVNWREKTINGQCALVMVSLKEEVEKISDDGFSVEVVDYHRVLLLEDGIYKQKLYNEDDELIIFDDGTDEIIPRKSDGSNWSEIPFQFVGAIDNNPYPDKAPLYDLAEVNVSHYRNSADFEESSFLVGQPTPVLSGLTQSWVDDVLKSGVKFGSRSAVLLPVDASAQLLQANPNQMPDRGMELKEQQMIKIGAKIITDSGGIETAESAKIRFAGQNSKLGMMVTNVERGIVNTINWSMEFMGGSGESLLKINRDFYEATVNPQLLVANMQLLDRGVIAMSDMRGNLRGSGLIEPERTDEEIEEEVGDVDPMPNNGGFF